LQAFCSPDEECSVLFLSFFSFFYPHLEMLFPFFSAWRYVFLVFATCAICFYLPEAQVFFLVDAITSSAFTSPASLMLRLFY